MKKEIYIAYPVSISWKVYEKLDKKYQDIGWIYNPYSNCWTHHFHKNKANIIVI